MNGLDLKKKAAMVLPYLQKAGWVSDPPPCSIADKLQGILKAAGDRIKVAGDILQFDELFVSDEELVLDPVVFEKKLKNDPAAVGLLQEFREVLAASDDFTAGVLEIKLKEFLEARNLKFGAIAAALRLALSGKANGLGLFDYCELLGKDSTLKRIEKALAAIVA